MTTGYSRSTTLEPVVGGTRESREIIRTIRTLMHCASPPGRIDVKRRPPLEHSRPVAENWQADERASFL